MRIPLRRGRDFDDHNHRSDVLLRCHHQRRDGPGRDFPNGYPLANTSGSNFLHQPTASANRRPSSATRFLVGFVADVESPPAVYVPHVQQGPDICGAICVSAHWHCSCCERLENPMALVPRGQACGRRSLFRPRPIAAVRTIEQSLHHFCPASSPQTRSCSRASAQWRRYWRRLGYYGVMAYSVAELYA